LHASNIEVSELLPAVWPLASHITSCYTDIQVIFALHPVAAGIFGLFHHLLLLWVDGFTYRIANVNLLLPQAEKEITRNLERVIVLSIRQCYLIQVLLVDQVKRRD
jgi:hypothetical protein